MTEGIQFNDPGGYKPMYTGPRDSGMVKMVMKFGLAKDSKQAQTVLIIIGVASVVIMGLTLLKSSTSKNYIGAPSADSTYASPSVNTGAHGSRGSGSSDDLFNF